MWLLGMSVYAIAVFQRSSLGVAGLAGLAAAAHFHAGPAALSLFTILQLSVYALMQVPVGLLADRVGPRRMLATGLMLMAVGQLGVALSDQLAGGIAARVLVGAGDAMSFVSLLRLISAWFPAHRCALMTQLTSLAGMVGNLASVLPMSALCTRTAGRRPSWRTLALRRSCCCRWFFCSAIGRAAGVPLGRFTPRPYDASSPSLGRSQALDSAPGHICAPSFRLVFLGCCGDFRF